MKRRVLLRVLLAIAVLGASAVGVGCCAFSAPGWDGPGSDHFDGETFINQGAVKERGTLDLLKWMLERRQAPWPEWIDAPPGPKPPDRVGRGDMRITFINHATTLLQMDELNILTDPIYSERASPVSFAGPKRVRPPGIRFDDLPKIDVILISHNHYDHFDVDTVRKLVARDHTKIYFGLGNNYLLKKENIDGGEDLDWWQERQLTDTVKLIATPAQHFSARGLCDRNQTLWMGFVISSPAGNVFFAGDTGFGPHFRQVGQKYGPMRLAILPIGAYMPEWFMTPIHVTPKQSLERRSA